MASDETPRDSAENNNDDPKEVSAMNPDGVKRAEFVWTLQATWQLVRIRLDMDSEFDQSVRKKKQLWETVAERVTANLRSTGNQDVPVKAYECDLKWRNLLATYRKNTERAKRLGAQSVHWEFFQTMHNVLGKRPQAREKQNRGTPSRAIPVKKITPILPIPTLSPTPYSSRPPQDVLQLYLELQERKINLWAQQKALEERKIEAINNLARAISSLAQENHSQLATESSG
ncbi:hypothetical protein GJAV_G00214000 [Gymnothorax javanicus]|nr:hypothetical protein GJAV_G00214000 [Gymnothorax javanicus]